MASNNVDGENNAQPGDDQTTASDIYGIAINSYNVYKGVVQDLLNKANDMSVGTIKVGGQILT